MNSNRTEIAWFYPALDTRPAVTIPTSRISHIINRIINRIINH